MDKLKVGHKRFLAEIFPRRRNEFHLLSKGQQPDWLFITCSDSRIVPDLVLGTAPGDLFIVRNAGNMIPEGESEVDGAVATVEYAVESLQVRHAIVCGHSDCGAVKAALDRKRGKQLVGMPQVERWLAHLEPAFALCARQPEAQQADEAHRYEALIRANVVAQLEHLRRHPSVARAVEAGRLTVHGWYYDILTGRIEQYDETLRRFLSWPGPELE